MFARVVRVVIVALSVLALSLVPAPARADEPVVIPDACTAIHPYDAALPMDGLQSGIEANWGFTLTGKYWTDETYRPTSRTARGRPPSREGCRGTGCS